MKVVMLKSGKKACVGEIEHSLEGMQEVVGGLIEACYYFEESVCIVANEEGKLIGLPLNRSIKDDDGRVIDIIAGDAFICDCSGEHFDSLDDYQIEKYIKMFENPERFMRIGDEILSIPYEPVDESEV